MKPLRILLVGAILLVTCTTLLGDEPDDDESGETPEAVKRFPQPVSVGALIGRTVLEPLESQPVLGHVLRIVRGEDGITKVIVNYGGLFGLGVRPIAVPVDAMVLLGQYMEIVDFKPEQLKTFPTFKETGSTSLAGNATIEVGLARPSH